MALLQKFGGSLGGVNMQKYLFLFTETCQQQKSYEFVPYRFGCFSFQSYADRRKLIEFNILADSEQWKLLSTQMDYLSMLDDADKKKMELFFGQFKSINGDDLIREVYRRFPYFATRSEVAESLMSEEELKVINEANPTQSEDAFFTIGYEGKSFENYLNRLIKNNVRVLCDVRKNPLSRKYGFSKKTLSSTLEKLDIEYVHIPDLGIVSDKRRELNSQADYNRLFNEYESTTLKQNERALDQLAGIFTEKHRVAITCFEAEHCMCHRGRVANAMMKRPRWNCSISHI
ncbi:DUF488 family protein [Pararhizobium sp. IMCC21322]|uniref:DUF488 domain-containing protein n=1 Tax=Pararhizobium sp. IMCC21322 TaxID=3067903 RepID=UPI002740DDF4|nr:DUF488 family protein [Pararhizobium sp. IMCC21322]